MTTDDHLREFDEFYRRHKLQLEGYLGTRLGIARDVVEEVVPDAFMVMRRHWARVRSPSPKAYLFRVARNAAFRLAKQRRYQTQPCVNIDDTATDMFASPSDVDRLADSSATELQVKRLLSPLTPRQREILILRYVAGFSVRETAEIMKIAPGTVTSSVFHARKRLQGLPAGPFHIAKEVGGNDCK